MCPPTPRRFNKVKLSPNDHGQVIGISIKEIRPDSREGLDNDLLHPEEKESHFAGAGVGGVQGVVSTVVPPESTSRPVTITVSFPESPSVTSVY